MFRSDRGRNTRWDTRRAVGCWSHELPSCLGFSRTAVLRVDHLARRLLEGERHPRHETRDMEPETRKASARENARGKMREEECVMENEREREREGERERGPRATSLHLAFLQEVKGGCLVGSSGIASGSNTGIQGYLAHKKQRFPRTLS
jgi:hypothetical protein